MTRVGLALVAVVAAASSAWAQPQPPPPPQAQLTEAEPTPLPRLSAAVGIGYFSTGTSSGRERVTALTFNADWRPVADPLWGVRLQYGYGSIEDGTSLVHSKRSSHLLTAHGTRHWRATGSLYLFGGLGLGTAVLRTVHEVGSDEQVGLALKPAWSWTAGVELPFDRFLVRMDVTGVWHEVSHDQIYAARVGARF